MPTANADKAKQNCETLFQEEPFVDLLTSDEGRGASKIASDQLGASLIGSACHRDALNKYFAASGWHLAAEGFGYSENGGSRERWERDAVYVYFKPCGFLRRILLPRCGMQVGVSMLEGKITHISAGFRK